jgi:hypothetical protein
MLFVGTAPPGGGPAPGLHHERFLPEDRLIGQITDALLAGYLAAIRTTLTP